MNSFRTSEDGFTLVELLVSLILVSFMMAYALAILAVVQNVSRLQDHSHADEEIDAAWSYLREAIGDVRAVTPPDSESGVAPLFQGNRDFLQFVGSSNGERQVGGLHIMRFFVNERQQLVATSTLLQRQPAARTHSTILLPGVRSLQFSYLGDDHASEADWDSHWSAGSALPVAIAVQVEFHSGGGKQWPALIVPVRTAQ